MKACGASDTWCCLRLEGREPSACLVPWGEHLCSGSCNPQVVPVRVTCGQQLPLRCQVPLPLVPAPRPSVTPFLSCPPALLPGAVLVRVCVVALYR